MNTNKYTNKFTLLFLVLFLAISNSFAQTANLAAPREEKLLNGLKLLIWNQPNADKISLKLRIHSGSAFDPQNKEGTMALLADILFPNEAQKEFFREDLGGSLEVASNYDYIQINATATTEQFLTLLETIANAVTNPQIDKETTAKVRAARLEKIKELEKNPAYIADQAVAKRLFGDFPYGRAQMGTSESLPKIDFADLILAKQKFLTPDNATIAISGNIKPDFVLRAARRYFGAWVKADKKIPATFAQPNQPDTKSFLVKTENENVSELRYAFRGLARNDRDFAASQVLAKILQNRWREREGGNAFVQQDAHLLPGFVVLKFSDWNVGKIKFEGNTVSLPGNFNNFTSELLKPDVKSDEFDKAKTEVLGKFNENIVDFWLDADTFKLSPVKNEMQAGQNLTVADAQKVLERWRKEAVVTTLLVTAPK